MEVRLDGVPDPLDQYVWDVRYVDDPVVRFHDGNTDGDLDGGSEEGDNTLYYTTDANWNVTALMDAETGGVVERYMYDPYGKATVLNGENGYDADGQVTEWTADAGGSDWANEILYCGYRFDPESGLYHVRHRHYHPTMGRWVTRDPIGYGEGMSLFEYGSSSPGQRSDAWGLDSDLFIGTETDRERARSSSAGAPQDISETAKKEGWSAVRDDQGQVVGFVKDTVEAYRQDSLGGIIGPIPVPGRNCAGHATGLDKNLQPKHGVPLGRLFAALGWKCYQMTLERPKCKCAPKEERMIVWLYQNPTKIDLWNNPWPGADPETSKEDAPKMPSPDAHCFKGPAGDSEEGSWTDVSGQKPFKDPKGNDIMPTSNTFYSVHRLTSIKGDRYCCCKCLAREQSKPTTEVSYAQ